MVLGSMRKALIFLLVFILFFSTHCYAEILNKSLSDSNVFSTPEDIYSDVNMVVPSFAYTEDGTESGVFDYNFVPLQEHSYYVRKMISTRSVSTTRECYWYASIELLDLNGKRIHFDARSTKEFCGTKFNYSSGWETVNANWHWKEEVFPPTATIVSPQYDLTIIAGESVKFEGQAVDDSNIVYYDWFFDGAAVNSDKEDPGSIIFETTGTYNVKFTVRDDDGLTDEATRTITVEGLAVPSADLSATESEGHKPFEVEFTGSCSGGEGNLASCTISFGDGLSALFDQNISHTYEKAEKVTARLTARNDNGEEAYADVEITVLEPKGFEFDFSVIGSVILWALGAVIVVILVYFGHKRFGAGKKPSPALKRKKWAYKGN